MENIYYSGQWYLKIVKEEGEEVYCYFDLIKDMNHKMGCPVSQLGSIEKIIEVIKGQKAIDELPQYECLRELNADNFKMYEEFLAILNKELETKTKEENKINDEINFKSFDIWEGVTIQDQENNFYTIKTLELKESDYQSIRLFEHQEKYYLLISNMVYCCQLEYEIKEIEKDIYKKLETQAININSYKSNIRDIENNIMKAEEDKNLEILNNYKEIRSEFIEELWQYKNSVNELINKNNLVA